MGNARLGRTQEGSKAAEGVVEGLFVDHGIEVSNEELSTDLDCLLFVGGGLVNANGFSVETYAIGDLGRIFGIFLSLELDEAVALVRTVDAINGKVNALDAAKLGHQLCDEGYGDTLIEIADIASGFLVLLPARS